jgi:hypothetical protein
VFSTLVTGANLEVVMSDTARFLDVLQNDFKRIMKELCQLDAEHAEAGQKRDEKQIKATILQNGGFAEVNSRCQLGIQGALVAIARNAVTEDSFKLMHGLGQLLAGQAKYEEALTWYDKALAGFEENGKEVSTATTYHNMASIYDEQGEYIKALAFYDKSLVIYLKTIGHDHPTTATTYGSMALVYVNQGEYTKALAFYDKTLAIRLNTLGPDHQATAGTYFNLGALCCNMGEYTQSLKHLELALAIYVKSLEPEHATISNVKSGIEHVKGKM